MRWALLAATVLGASDLWGDESKIAFVAPGVGRQADILLMDRYGHYKTNITRALGEDREPSWSPDGSQITFTSDRHYHGFTDGYETDIYVMNIDGSGVVNLTHSPVIDQSPIWSPDGSRIAFFSDFFLYTMRPDGTDRKPVLATSPLPQRVSWSPDGTKMLITDKRSPDWREPWDAEIFVVDLGSGLRTNLTNAPSSDTSPAWSPDGTRVAFVSNRGGTWDIWVMNADGTGQRNLTNDAVEDGLPSWSPDGKRILFETYRNMVEAFGTDYGYYTDSDIYAMDVDGGNLVNLTPDMAGASAPTWSPVPVPTAIRVLSWGAVKAADLGR